MRDYELTILLKSDISEAALEEKKKELDRLCGAEAENAVEINDQGVQQLAYDISHQGQAHFLQLRFRSEPSRIAELESKLRLDDQVLRHMVIRLED